MLGLVLGMVLRLVLCWCMSWRMYRGRVKTACAAQLTVWYAPKSCTDRT